MKKYIEYCDICKRRITKKTKVKKTIYGKLKTIAILYVLYSNALNWLDLEVICNDCYNSFSRWYKIRISHNKRGKGNV